MLATREESCVSLQTNDNPAFTLCEDRRFGDAITQVLEANGPPARAACVTDAPLACLAGGALESRFHAWHGASGARYICTIQSLINDAGVPHCPDFDDFVMIGVARLNDGHLQPRLLVEIGATHGWLARLKLAHDAARMGVSEWHIHLLAETSQARQQAMSDLGKIAPTARLIHLTT